VVNAVGTANEEVLVKSDHEEWGPDWSADGRFIIYTDNDPNTKNDIWVLPMEGNRKPFPFLQTRFYEQDQRFCPDGHYVAYASNESGTNEVYVQGFPPTKGKWPISTAGGHAPLWRPDGKELFYANGDTLMAVDVSGIGTGEPFKAGVPHPLFHASFSNNRTSFTVNHDGSRFIINVLPDAKTDAAPSINVVLNWQAQLKK
jgi:Tol biopolymer transport system component